MQLSGPSGDGVADIPHKLEVLERHCTAVGRDRREITVTYKGMLFVAETEAGARKAWDAYREPRGLPGTAEAFVGSAEQVGGQVAAFLEAGVDEVVVELPDAHDPESLRRAAAALKSAETVATT